MKKNLLLSFAFVALFIGQFSLVSAQPTPCTVDPQYSAPGIYPSDTLQDMVRAVPTQQVVQFVFPIDTVIFGQTLNFDSFLVSAVSNIPLGMDWQCNNNHPTCHYVSNPPNLTRGCVTVYGTPSAASPAYPGYDSIIVTGTAYVTIPFIGVQSFGQDIPVFYRISNTIIGTPSPFANAGLSIAPVPVSGRANVYFTLVADANVKLSVMDLMGREVAVITEGMQRQGNQEFTMDSKDLASGSYILKLNVNDGEFVQTKKFTSVR